MAVRSLGPTQMCSMNPCRTRVFMPNAANVPLLWRAPCCGAALPCPEVKRRASLLEAALIQQGMRRAPGSRCAAPSAYVRAGIPGRIAIAAGSAGAAAAVHIPLEVYELLREPGWVVTLVLIVNLAVDAVMIQALRRRL